MTLNSSTANGGHNTGSHAGSNGNSQPASQSTGLNHTNRKPRFSFFKKLRLGNTNDQSASTASPGPDSPLKHETRPFAEDSSSSSSTNLPATAGAPKAARERGSGDAGSSAVSTGSSGLTSPSHRVQILDQQPQQQKDSDSLFSSKRPNSSFTVPSVSHTSISTMSPSVQSDNLSVHTTHTTHPGNALLDTASVVTLASSSRKRRSFDTNASTHALAPDSIMTKSDQED